MPRSYEVLVNDELSLQIKTKDEFTLDELMAVTLGTVHIAIETCYNQTIQNHPEADEKQVRAQIYDNLILALSHMVNSIYPEHVELYKKTPEAILEELDKKVKEIDEKTRDKVS